MDLNLVACFGRFVDEGFGAEEFGAEGFGFEGKLGLKIKIW